MAKKKKAAKADKRQNKEFGSSPFRDLKGFAVSAEQEKKSDAKVAPARPVQEVGSFATEMEMLGVKKLMSDEEDQELLPFDDDPQESAAERSELSEDEQFLQAMLELQVNFQEQLPEARSAVTSTASASRMKQLKQGKLKPEASLDLHGQTRAEVVERLRFFLQNAERQGWKTVLVITGRGLHSSDGEPVLRNEVEAFLAREGRKQVAEWCRAPKQYGGSGALVLFLKQAAR